VLPRTGEDGFLFIGYVKVQAAEKRLDAEYRAVLTEVGLAKLK
jgi:uncharacterized protein YunC (DUF1805 family)